MRKFIVLFLLALSSSFTVILADTVPDECSIPYEDRTDEDENDYSVCDDFIINTNPSEGIEVYEGEFITSEGTYNRISYDSTTEIWQGVVQVIDYEVVDTGVKSATWINLAFSRELKSLQKIVLEYTSEKECEHFGLFGICIGGMYYPETFYETLDNTIVDGAWNENFLLHNDDIIEYTSAQSGNLFNPGEYDYSIFLHEIPLERQIDIIYIVDFVFVLTDAEIIQLGLDIEDQYSYEVSEINSNITISNDEKQQQLIALNSEYNEIPDLSFDMVFEQYCPPEDHNCILLTPDVSGEEETIDEVLEEAPDWVQGIVDNLVKVIAALVAGLMGVAAVSVIAYKLFSKGVDVAGNATWYSFKSIVIAGGWWGLQIATGILTIFKTIFNGLKAVLRVK